MKPLLKYLNSELEATHSIEKYSNISDLFEITEDERELKELAFEIFKKCLAKDQKIEENYLGLQLFTKISSFLSEEELNEAKGVIGNNDNRDEWDDTIKENLKLILRNSVV